MFTIISVVPSSYMVSSLFLLLLPLLRTSALHVGVRGDLRPSPGAKRDHISGLENDRNLEYMVNITLGDQPIQILIDTGSSDLWVSSTIATANDTGIESGVTYDIGEVSGEVKTAQLEFLGYTVPDQAFIEVTPTSNTPQVAGFLGLGPNSGSRIHASLNNQPEGDTVLDRIFRQNVSSPNFLTVLLGRSSDPAEKYPGDITVGEVLQGLENISSQPQVPVTILQTLDSSNQHWQVLLDEDGIIGPDGQPILVQTGVQSTPNPNQLTTFFDTGFSFPQVPLEVSNAIYSGVPGASLQSVDGFGLIWLIPCDAEIDIAFKIGGQTYPVHPLDTNADVLTNSDGQTCVGAFQPISSGTSSTYDLILGMAFLRNAYLLVNFGDFVDGSVNTTANPYVQLLSVTDPTAAHADFVNVRLNGTNKNAPTQVDEALRTKLRPTIDLSQPTSSSGSFKKEKIPIIIVLSIGGALVLIGLIAVYCSRDRFAKRGRGGLANTYQSYQRLSVPAPAGDMHHVQGYHGSWGRR
ncbi:acid protease [Russula ochroleuca]|uniref:Acid protease n=1 Tax=Russula ochroleuca TaxID=152965 RepID=A0A9P5MQ30_9AGAM|nr:acid protease [Russula ochroleuca]